MLDERERQSGGTRMRMTKTHSWKREQITKRVRIARRTDNEETRRFYGYSHTLEKKFLSLDGEVVVDIDIDGIVQRLVGTAAHNSSGKAIALGGMIKAKRVKERVVSERVETFLIPEGYSEVKP
jgi:hypothetical protein